MRPRAQCALSLLMLGAMLATFAGLLWIADRSPIFANHVASEITKVEQTGGLYYFDNAYVDEGDYVLIQQLNGDDYSRGGVYFVGTSEIHAAFTNWLLTPEEARLIHNYSIGNLRHGEVGQFLRMLVEDYNLLEAGGDRTTVILSLNFQLTRINRDETYAQNLFRRHGLYTFDAVAGIHRADIPALRRWFLIERDKVNRALRLMFAPTSRVISVDDTMDERYAHMRRAMAGDWQEEMRRQVGLLAEQIDYLQARGVRVRAIYAPRGTWQDDLPYESAYLSMVEPILAARGVPVEDMRRIVPDDGFRDAIHVKYRGRLIFHEALMNLGRQSLGEMGAGLEPARSETSH